MSYQSAVELLSDLFGGDMPRIRFCGIKLRPRAVVVYVIGVAIVRLGRAG